MVDAYYKLSPTSRCWFGIVLCLLFPFGPFLWFFFYLCYEGEPGVKVQTDEPDMIDKKFKNELTHSCQAITSCLYHSCPVGIDFASNLNLKEAISRYEEHQPRKTIRTFLQEVASNGFLITLLEILNGINSNFFFKILPAGSLREGFGRPLPSNSILASDCDLMLVPDAVHVQEEEMIVTRAEIKDDKRSINRCEGNGDDDDVITMEPIAPVLTATEERYNTEPAVFQAITDPRENPETPTGYLWLKLNNHSLYQWRSLCIPRQYNSQTELFLSQLAVYRLVQNSLGNFGNIKNILRYTHSDVDKMDIQAIRSGPAVTVYIFKKTYYSRNSCWNTKREEKKEEMEIEREHIFEADFTVALHCPKFPKSAQGFFQCRRTVNNSEPRKVWPTNEIVDIIEQKGCHVVPKPSEKTLVILQSAQSDNSYISQSVGLEWRFSFSQAEMILADNLPPPARSAYLAFKATVKYHISKSADRFLTFHNLPSYILKTILYREVEKTPIAEWSKPNSEVSFFKVLFDSLHDCVKIKVQSAKCDTKKMACPHFWIPKIDLMNGISKDSAEYFDYKLTLIKNNYVRFVANNWLETERFLRLNCCRCFYKPPVKMVVWKNKEMARKSCFDIKCSYSHNTCCFGPMVYNEEQFYVY